MVTAHGETSPLVIVGAGGFGREVLDAVERAAAAGGGSTRAFLGFLDDGDPDRDQLIRRGAAFLGPSNALPAGAQYLIGVGDPVDRALLDASLAAVHHAAPALVDPAASIGSGVSLGAGTVLLAGARVSTNARLGRHCHINLNAVVAHDTVLGDCVSLSPNASTGGGVTIGSRVLLGLNASVLPGVTIGDDVVVGAGAVVTSDVAPGSTVVGTPARPVGGKRA